MEISKVASLRMEQWALTQLLPHPLNPRIHPEPGSTRWAALLASLEHDYFDPLVVNVRNKMLVSGHLRLKVLLSLGFTHADVSVVDYDEDLHKARLIAANNLIGKWEEEILEQLARDIEQSDVPSGLTGFDVKGFASLLDGPTIDDDSATALELVSEAENIQAQWQVQPGDLYLVGSHRVLCGDSTDPQNWKLLLDGGRADMFWTDPPYNIDYEATQAHRLKYRQETTGATSAPRPEEIKNDHLSKEAFYKLLHASFSAAFHCTKPGGGIYIAHAESEGLSNRRAMAESGWYQAQCLVWVKQAFTLGRQDCQWQHEPILYGWKLGAAHYWQGGYCQPTTIDDEPKHLSKWKKKDLIAVIQQLRNERDTTVIREPRGSSNSFHPTVKPLGLVARQIWNSSRKGEIVGDLFGGSGTTLIAAEQTERRAAVCDLEPKFCAVTLERAKRIGLPIQKIDHA